MKKLNDAVDRFAYSHPNFGIPNLMRYIVAGSVIVFLLLRLTNYAIFSYLGFNWGAVLHLQLWRLVSFVFVPDATDPFSLILSLYFTYFIGDLLEREWGTPKFNLYYFSGVVLTILVGIIGYYAFGAGTTIYSTYYIGMSMFLAFAALYPDAQVLLLFFIPIKVKWLAWADAALFAVDILSALFRLDFVSALIPVIALLNFLVFFWSDLSGAFGRQRQRVRHQHSHQTIQFKAAARQQQKREAQQGYRHKCSVCGRTDTEFPELEFRYCSKCAGYHCFCQDHIYNHVHFTE
ncbi:rhomboid family intramembrane serine protease [Dysosmobacter sp.]